MHHCEERSDEDSEIECSVNKTQGHPLPDVLFIYHKIAKDLFLSVQKCSVDQWRWQLQEREPSVAVDDILKEVSVYQ